MRLFTASLYSYNPTDYNFVNYLVNNQTQNINLYLLQQSVTTPFIILVQSQNQLPLENYYVNIYRYDSSSNTPYLVQSTQTDSQGQTIGFFEINTVDYMFIITDSNGNVVYTSEKKKIIPTSTPYTLTFTVGSILPSPVIYYNNLTGVTWNLGYNKATFISSLSYTDSNSTFNYAVFTVKVMNYSGSNNVICNITNTNPSGVMTCDLTGNLSGSYYAEFYVSRNNILTFVDRLQFSIEGMTQVAGMMGLLGAFFIILLCAFLFFYNAIAGIISINIGLIVCQLIGILNLGITGISAIIAISVIIIIVMVRD